MPRLVSCCAAASCEGRPSSNVNETVVLGAAIAEEETQEAPRGEQARACTSGCTIGSTAAEPSASRSTPLARQLAHYPSSCSESAAAPDSIDRANVRRGSRIEASLHRGILGLPRSVSPASQRRMPFDGDNRHVVPTPNRRATGVMRWTDCEFGVIGLGWFGEIHCETIVGVPNLELAALCTRTPERLAAMAAKFGVQKTYRDYRRPARRSRDRRGLDRDHVGPAHRAGDRRARGRQARLPRKADGLDGRRLPGDHRRGGEGRRASCSIGHICRFNPRYRMAKQAIERGRSARSSRSARAATSPRRGRRRSSTRSARSSATRSTTPT